MTAGQSQISATGADADAYDDVRAGDAIAVAARFATDGLLIINGRKQTRIPFAGSHHGPDGVQKVLTDISEAIDVLAMTPQILLRENVAGEDTHRLKLIACCNVEAVVRATRTTIDLEFAIMIELDAAGKVRTARVFYDTDITRRAFEQHRPQVLRDEKGTGIHGLVREVSFEPARIVPQIYRIIFEGVSREEHVPLGALARSAAEFLGHNFTRSPFFWFRLLRHFNAWDLLRQAAMLRPYYSPQLLHMIKGGETDVELCGTYHGRQGLSDFALRLFSELEYEDVPPQLATVSDGNWLGVHMPETFVNKATGTRAVVHMLHLWRFDKDGKVVEFKSYNDTYEIVDSYGLASRAVSF